MPDSSKAKAKPAQTQAPSDHSAMPPIVREMANELLGTTAEQAALMAEHLHQKIPELGGPDIELLRETRASCEANIVQSYRLLHSGGAAADLVLPSEAGEYARSFVRRGIQVPVLLRTYRLGHAWIWARWVDALRERIDDPAELATAIESSSSWMFAYIDLISAELVDDFTIEQARQARSVEQIHAATVRALLAGELIDDEVATRRLSYDLRRHHLALHLWGDNDQAGGLERAAHEAAASVGCSSPLIVACSTAALDVWCGFDAAPAELIERLADYRPPAGIRLASGGMPMAGISGFRQAHHEATQAAHVAELAGPRLGAVTRYTDVELVSLLIGDLDRARRFMHRVLGKLAAGDEQAERLRQTVLTFLRCNRSSGQAAKQLFVHQNTVAYRVRRAEELLDHPVTENPAELLCALILAAAVGTED